MSGWAAGPWRFPPGRQQGRLRSEVLARVCFLPGNLLRPRRRWRQRFPAERKPPRSRLPQRAEGSGARSGLRRPEPVRARDSRASPVSNFVWTASLRALPPGPGLPPQVRASAGCWGSAAPGGRGGGRSGAAAVLHRSPPLPSWPRGSVDACGAGRACPGREDQLPCAPCPPPGRRLGEAGGPGCFHLVVLAAVLRVFAPVASLGRGEMGMRSYFLRVRCHESEWDWLPHIGSCPPAKEWEETISPIPARCL